MRAVVFKLVESNRATDSERVITLAHDVTLEPTTGDAASRRSPAALRRYVDVVADAPARRSSSCASAHAADSALRSLAVSGDNFLDECAWFARERKRCTHASLWFSTKRGIWRWHESCSRLRSWHA